MLLKTQIVSENGWLEDDPFLQKGHFSEAMLVLGRIVEQDVWFA